MRLSRLAKLQNFVFLNFATKSYFTIAFIEQNVFHNMTQSLNIVQLKELRFTVITECSTHTYQPKPRVRSY